MISNTVIVFLRDLLPIFILYSFVNAMSLNAIQRHHFFWISVSIVGVLSTLILYSFIELISESFDGAGIEFIYSLAFSVMWVCLIITTAINNNASQGVITLFLSIGIIVFTMIKGAEFLIYFGVVGQSEDNLLPIFLGCVIGIGICISFSLLLKFLLIETRQSNGNWLFSLLWFAFLAGQLSQIIGLLSQVGLIDVGLPLFKTGKLISDASEYGHVLNALIGYESSPSLAFTLLYSAAIGIPIIFKALIGKSSSPLSIAGTK